MGVLDRGVWPFYSRCQGDFKEQRLGTTAIIYMLWPISVKYIQSILENSHKNGMKIDCHFIDGGVPCFLPFTPDQPAASDTSPIHQHLHHDSAIMVVFLQ